MDENITTTQETEETNVQDAQVQENVHEAAETTEDAAGKKSTDEGSVQNETPKTFTQAEVDEIVRRRLARASKDNQVTAAENAALRSSIACFKAGVKAECVEDAVALASKYVDDKTDFDAALAKVLEKYPTFSSPTAPRAQTAKDTSPNMQGKKAPEDNSAFYKALGIRKIEEVN